VRIGTRGSALALAQATPVAEALGGELVVITTTGDRDRAAGDKGRWVGELERALLDEEIDVAIHSAKDVPSELADGTRLLASPARADPRDALCGAASLGELREGALVGTASLRRRAQLLALRPDLEVVELRGNVDTRLRKLADGDYDAIVLAQAGLDRLGRGAEGTPLDELVPAAGQGILALQARDDLEVPFADTDATEALAAERAFVAALQGDCDTPVGAHYADGTLRAFIGRADGSMWLTDSLDKGSDPRLSDSFRLGEEVARRMLAAGADEVLGR
jgi:hydroxymethylbilane synthase